MFKFGDTVILKNEFFDNVEGTIMDQRHSDEYKVILVLKVPTKFDTHNHEYVEAFIHEKYLTKKEK